MLDLRFAKSQPRGFHNPSTHQRGLNEGDDLGQSWILGRRVLINHLHFGNRSKQVCMYVHVIERILRAVSRDFLKGSIREMKSKEFLNRDERR